jgi:hypothetical protein
VTSSSRASKIGLKIECVMNFQTLTKDAQLRVSPQTERLMVKFSEPEFESLWIFYKNKFEFNQIRENGLNFLGLFKFPDKPLIPRKHVDDSALTKLLQRLGDHGMERQLEAEKGKSSYGLLEFSIRFSMNFHNEWRKSDERYLRLKELRDSKLSNESWNASSFLDFPEICTALESLNEDSYKFFGADSISLACFFQHRVEFLDNQEKLNLEAIIRDASKMFINEYDDACFNFLYLIGCLIGPEKVVELKYFHTNTKYLFINADKTKGNSLIDFSIPSPITEPTKNAIISKEGTSLIDVSINQKDDLVDSSTLEVIAEKRTEKSSTLSEIEPVISAIDIKDDTDQKIEKDTSSNSEIFEKSTSINSSETKETLKSKEEKNQKKTGKGRKVVKSSPIVTDNPIPVTQIKPEDQPLGMENNEKPSPGTIDFFDKKS